MSRVIRRAPLATDGVERALDRAAGVRSVPGNAVSLLLDGPDAFEVMLEAIRQAQRWIHFDNYIFRDDVTGERFATALMERARDGVAVRVMADWLGSFGTGRSFWRRLTSAGATVQLFHRPSLFDVPSFLIRNHRKILVTDGGRAIIGGICIGDEWAGDAGKNRLPWRDTAVDILGPAAAAIDRAFARVWGLNGTALPTDELASHIDECGSAAIRVLVGEPARERAYRVTELLLAAASQRVWISDAYLVAPRRLFRYLADAAEEGVDVRLLVPGTSDLRLVRNLTRVGYRELLRSGVRIFEWGGPMLHAKTVVADGRWVRIGSSNMNHSSLVANYELDVLVDDPPLAVQLEGQFRRDLEQSAEVVTRPRRVPRQVQRVIPLALQIQQPEDRPAGHRRGIRERRRRTVLAVRTLVAGARLAIFGPLAVAMALLGVLFIIVPVFMGMVFGVVFGWLALVAGAAVLRRRREAPPPSP